MERLPYRVWATVIVSSMMILVTIVALVVTLVFYVGHGSPRPPAGSPDQAGVPQEALISETPSAASALSVASAQPLPQPAPPETVAPPPVRPEKENFDRFDPVYKREFGPPGAPNVTFERLPMGGVRVTSQNRAVNSEQAVYGLVIYQKTVRDLGLSDEQLAAVQAFERSFAPVIDQRLAQACADVEQAARALSDAITSGNRSASVKELNARMKQVQEQWPLLATEYQAGLQPILTTEQYAKLDKLFNLPKKP